MSRGQGSFDSYLKAKFSGGKIDFSRIDEETGASVIPPTERGTFIDAFIKFEKLTWDQIYTSTELVLTLR